MLLIDHLLCWGDYVKLNSPPDSLLEDSDNAFEMRDMRPAPPKTLALNSSTAFNSNSDVRSSTKAARAASAGRVSAIGRGGGGAVVEHHQVKEYAVYLLGGTERDGSVTVFKKPMAVWKLSMFFRNVQWWRTYSSIIICSEVGVVVWGIGGGGYLDNLTLSLITRYDYDYRLSTGGLNYSYDYLNTLF